MTTVDEAREALLNSSDASEAMVDALIAAVRAEWADPLRASDLSMAEHSDTRSHCPRCGEWRDSPTADCASCGYAATQEDRWWYR